MSIAPSQFISFITSKIRNKLVVAFLAVALLPLIGLAWSLSSKSDSSLMEQAFNQLSAVRTIKANQLTEYFELIENQIVTFSENRMVVDAMSEFPRALETARNENSVSEDELKQIEKDLFAYYANDFTTEYRKHNKGVNPPLDEQFAALDDDSAYLQNLYISQNPNPLGEKGRTGQCQR